MKRNSVLLIISQLLAVAVSQDTSEQCSIGDLDFVSGESFGEAFRIECGDPSEWPCFCRPGLERDAECPYCSYRAGDGTLYCAKNGQTVTFPDGSIQRECTCQVPDDPTQDKVSTCTILDAGCSWLDLEGNDIVIPEGESFGDLIDGACGSGTDWPSFCFIP